jgi:hypothetical protein
MEQAISIALKLRCSVGRLGQHLRGEGAPPPERSAETADATGLRLALIIAAMLAAGIIHAEDVTLTLDAAPDSAFVVTDADSNIVSTVSATGVTLSGGMSNVAYGPFSTVSGGVLNSVPDDGWYATIGGGYGNAATTGSTTIAGGYYNGANGLASTVGGGAYNSAVGNYGTVPGGLDSHASGAYSFAAGRGAVASHSGTFVWADGTPAYVASTADNQFVVRASGGARFFSDTNATIGVLLSPGGTGWSGVSDRNLKENFTPVDSESLLVALSAIPMTTWNMKSQDDSIRHIGPMAQDFHAAFGVGEDDTHISYSDADGVSLAAIQGLHQLLQERIAETLALRLAIERLDQRLSAIEANANDARTGE